MTEKEVCRYIGLAARKSFILSQSGTGWKPEYKQELTQINEELKVLRRLVDAEHERRKRK